MAVIPGNPFVTSPKPKQSRVVSSAYKSFQPVLKSSRIYTRFLTSAKIYRFTLGDIPRQGLRVAGYGNVKAVTSTNRAFTISLAGQGEGK